MATPNARQIVFGTSVIPKQTANTTSTQETLEDGTTVGVAQYTDTILDTTIAKRFGGKGTVTTNKDQAYEGWVSFWHPADSEVDGIDSTWGEEGRNWGEIVEVSSTNHTLRTDTVDCNFLYVKNTGDTETARVILDGSSGEPDILLPPGASISLRLNSVSSADIRVDAAANTTTVEYILTKE